LHFKNIRVGFGYDVHQLAKGRPLIIGGVELNYHQGALGHSDADVLLHAICDALLGAANMRDIGFHFPDTDPTYKDADSKVLLSEVGKLIETKGYSISNIDSTVSLEKPKLKDHIGQMQQNIATLLGIEEDQVAIKATTGEKMGFVGNEKGITAHAVCLLYRA
jgi:2-C-methyl-D-erythritol 2,4-cyclodiphosphate synthase